MPTKEEKIKSALSKLMEITGEEGAAVVSFDGLVISTELDPKYDADKAAGILSEAVRTANEVVKTLGHGEPEQMLIEGTNGKVVINRNRKKNFFVVLLGSPKLSLGLARTTIDEVLDELEDII